MYKAYNDKTTKLHGSIYNRNEKKRKTYYIKSNQLLQCNLGKA
jgi:hypothetical protein